MADYDSWEDFSEIIGKNYDGLFSSVDLNLTTKCQHRCKMCFKNFADLNKDKYLELDILKEAYKQFRMEGAFKAFISGGEPTLYPWFEEFIAYLADLKYGITIVTNGLNLDRFIDTFMLENVREVRVSLLGLNETHDKIIGLKGSFDKVFNNLKKLSVLHNKIDISYNVLKSNYMTFEETIKTVLDSFPSITISVGLPFFSAYNQKRLKNEKISVLEKKHLLKTLDKLSKNYENRIRSTFNFYEKGKRTPVCLLGLNRLSIDVDGNVYPCMSLEHELINLKSIENMEDLRAELKKSPFWDYVAKAWNECSNCEILDYCQSCPALNYGINNETFSPSKYQCSDAYELKEILNENK
jgi:radical SAM protein with 4Fe4S-binding SPASM domain